MTPEEIESSIIEYLYAHRAGCTRPEWERAHAYRLTREQVLGQGSWGGPVGKVWSQLANRGSIIPRERRNRGLVYVLAPGLRELMDEVEP